MRLLALVFLFSSLASSQIAVDGITASVSRTVTLQPDEATVNVVVSTALDTTRQQVTDALQAAGLPSLTLAAVAAQTADYGYPLDSATQTFYQFTFTVPAADINGINAKLEGLRTRKPDPLTSVRYQSWLRSSQLAAEAERQRQLPLLLADARKRADALATAAGLKLGAIQAVNDTSYSPFGVSNLLLTGISGGSFGSASPDNGLQITFSLYVKFASN